MTKGRIVLLLPLLLGLASGCGTAKSVPANLTGKVTYNGAPVTAGTLTFYPKEGGGVYPMALNSDGTYSGTDLPLGAGDVAIETESANKKNAQTYGGGRAPAMSSKPPGSGGTEQGAYVMIPAKYAKKETSNLTVTLTKGNNTNNIDLKD
jgi:hypothetical protein